MAHTDGEWRATIYSGAFDQPLILSESGVDIIARVHSLPDRQHEANAKLIAAAPALLEALKGILESLERENLLWRYEEETNLAISAIKKATE